PIRGRCVGRRHYRGCRLAIRGRPWCVWSFPCVSRNKKRAFPRNPREGRKVWVIFVARKCLCCSWVLLVTVLCTRVLSRKCLLRTSPDRLDLLFEHRTVQYPERSAFGIRRVLPLPSKRTDV